MRLLRVSTSRDGSPTDTIIQARYHLVGRLGAGGMGEVWRAVRDFVEGRPRRELLRHGPLPLSRALRFVDDLCAGLTYAHDRHVVHRDIKPVTLIVLQEAMDRLMFVDFGMARRLDTASETTTGLAIGTLSHMAPEQQVRKPCAIDHRADIFSVGAVFYEMVAGVPAFGAGP